MMYCHALLISLKQMYVISFLTLLFFGPTIYNIGQNGFYHHLFKSRTNVTLSFPFLFIQKGKREREEKYNEKAYFFLFTY
jgi:hypothetical protein